jgi:WhiB family transcriptional regulator, redox-sensing transcriptional regulator
MMAAQQTAPPARHRARPDQQSADDLPAVRLLVRGRWRALAGCRTTDPDLFFPVSVSGRSLAQVTEAKAICAACPVRPECLAFAIETGQVHGIWGGLTEEERRQALRRGGNRTRSPGPAAVRLIDKGRDGRRARLRQDFLLPG